MDKKVDVNDLFEAFNELLDEGQLNQDRLEQARALLNDSLELVPENDRRLPFDAPVRVRHELLDEQLQEGFALDAANKLAKSLRNAAYKLRIGLGYSGARVVEVGDSWFQYPVLLQDIIDQLTDDFAVYSLSAAGATLTDMILSGEFETAIRAEKPHYLLISGGGNDILGAPLANMLKPNKQGAKASDLVDMALLDANVAQIVTNYRRICDRARAIDPNLKIAIHGYDYVIPRKKGGSWLKKPLEAKKIPLTQIANDVLKIIIDRFNDALRDFAATYPQGRVYYVDLRGSVGNTAASWFDEIHPRNKGFESAAKRMKAKINSQVSTAAPAMLTEAVIDRPGRWFDAMQNPQFSIQASVSRLSGQTASSPSGDIQPLEFAAMRANPLIEEAWSHLKVLSVQANEPEDPRLIANRAHYSYHGAPRGFQSFERIIRQNDFDEFFVLHRGVRTGRAVARLSVPNAGVGTSRATGFLVGPGLLVTNNHVLPSREAAKNCIISLDYELNENGIPRQSSHFRATDEIFITSAPLDYTFISVEPVNAEGRVLADWGWNALLPLSGKAVKNEYVNIIQHPNGDFKKVVLRENKVIGRADDFIYYEADTEPGSSGGCVTNVEWQVTALHHFAVPDPSNRDKFIANRGVRISSILRDISMRRQSSDADAQAVEERLDAGRNTQPSGFELAGSQPITFSPRPPGGSSQKSDELAEDIFLEGLDTEGDIYCNPSNRPLFESTLPNLSATSARWPNNRKNCPDTWHLPTHLGSAPFKLTSDVLEALCGIGDYPLDTTNQKLIVSLRGCRFANGEDHVEDTESVDLQPVNPDHHSFRCLLGVWDRSTRSISLYLGSTVPNRKYMKRYYDRVNFGTKGTRCNLLPTGFYRYSVGTHFGGGGSKKYTKILRLGDGPMPADSSKATVLRTTNDLIYGTMDDWDNTRPSDNIHPAFGTNTFSSAGCQTVRGSQTPNADASTGTGEWAAFRVKAGFDVASNGTMYDNLLVTGIEAAAVAEVLLNGGSLNTYRCLRHGSFGSRTETLQRQLGVASDGKFGPGTRKALALLQDRKLGLSTGTWSAAMAEQLGMSF